jgi:F5/8 type C domain
VTQELQTHAVQNNFLSGVLDPRAQGRIDTNAYVSSMLQGINVEMVHLGGVQRRRGLVNQFVMPNALTLLSGTYSCPNGPASPTGLGTNSQVHTNTTTTPPNTTDPYVLVTCDLGSPQNVLFADCLAITLASGSSTQFCIQYSNDNSNWTTLGASFYQLDSTANYTYRRTGGVTFPKTYTNARYWRVVKIGGANLTSEITFSDFVLWGETSSVGFGRLIPFEVSTNEQYMLAVSDNSGIVLNHGQIVDYVALPYASAIIPLMDAQSSAESMMIVEQNRAPQFLVRLSSPLATGVANQTFYNFQTFLAQFAGIPQIDYDDSLSPTPTSDVQSITFGSGWNVGDTFTITIQTDTTGSITYLGDNQATANAMATAVQALWVVNGFTGVSCVSNGGLNHTMTFANDAAANIGPLAITSLSSSATATATETSVGSSRQENAWSSKRGYPSTVTFYQGRLWLGGLLSQPESLLGSWVNDVLQFATEQGLDDQAVFVTMNGVALNAVQGLFPGRSLCVFTTGGEFRFVNDSGAAITPTSFPTNQTQYGSAKIRPVMVDGNIIFVQRNGNSIRDFQFDYVQDQFNSLGLSSFASNLVYNVVDLAAWNGSLSEEMNLALVVNGINPNLHSATNPNPLPSNTCAVYNTRKEANVQGWTLWETAGAFVNVGTVLQDMYFLCVRTLNGVGVMTCEMGVSGSFMDCSTGPMTVNAPSTTISGLGWLNGVTCRMIADGYVLDNVVPVNGQVSPTIDGRPYTVQSTYEIGLNFNPTVQPMPLQTTRWQIGSNLAHKKRIVRMRCRVQNTLGLLYNGEPLATQTIDTFNFDSAPVPYSGILEIEDSSFWDQTVDKTVTFTQVDPLPFYLMYIDTELAEAS